MTSFFKRILNVLFIILKSLRPILLVAFVFFVLFGTLFIYDQVKTIQDRNLAATLSKNIDVKSTCTTELIGSNEKFDLKFSFRNSNKQSVFVEKVGVDLDLLGLGEKKFSRLLSTKPTSRVIGVEKNFQLFEFSNPVEIKGEDKSEFVLNMQTTTRKTAMTNPNTIVIYEGEIRFFLSPEFTNTGNCKIQVRYSR